MDSTNDSTTNDATATDSTTEHEAGTPNDPHAAVDENATGREPDGSGGGVTSAASSNYPAGTAEAADERIQDPADVPKSELPATHEVTDEPEKSPEVVPATGEAATTEPVNAAEPPPTDPVKVEVQPQAPIEPTAPVVVEVNRQAALLNPAAIAATVTRTTVDGGSTEDYDPAERGRQAALIGEGNYEGRLRLMDANGNPAHAAFPNGTPIASVPSIERPGHSPEAVAEKNLESTHVAGQTMKYAVLIPKSYSSDVSIRFSNGLTFHQVPVGIETNVSEAVYQVMRDSDVPFEHRPL